MSKQVTKSHVRDAVHMYLVNWGAMLTDYSGAEPLVFDEGEETKEDGICIVMLGVWIWISRSVRRWRRAG